MQLSEFMTMSGRKTFLKEDPQPWQERISDQKLYDHVAGALLGMTDRSVSDRGKCEFISKAGNRCAVGHIIREELYRPQMEAMPFVSFTGKYPHVFRLHPRLQKAFVFDLEEWQIRMMYVFQFLHDRPGSMSRWPSDLVEVANHFRLKHDIVDEKAEGFLTNLKETDRFKGYMSKWSGDVFDHLPWTKSAKMMGMHELYGKKPSLIIHDELDTSSYSDYSSLEKLVMPWPHQSVGLHAQMMALMKPPVWTVSKTQIESGSLADWSAHYTKQFQPASAIVENENPYKLLTGEEIPAEPITTADFMPPNVPLFDHDDPQADGSAQEESVGKSGVWYDTSLLMMES